MTVLPHPLNGGCWVLPQGFNSHCFSVVCQLLLCAFETFRWSYLSGRFICLLIHLSFDTIINVIVIMTIIIIVIIIVSFIILIIIISFDYYFPIIVIIIIIITIILTVISIDIIVNVINIITIIFSSLS